MDHKLYVENYLSASLLFFSLTIALLVFFFKLKKEGLSFQLGILFGLLFFLFIPSLFLIFSGSVEIDAFAFVNSEIPNIYLHDASKEISILSVYILLISLWTLFAKNHKKHYSSSKKNLLLIIYVSFLASISIGFTTYFFSGMSAGGSDWYSGTESFTKSLGTFGVLLAFLHMSARLVFISYFFKFYKTYFQNKLIGLVILIAFGVFDSLLTGNRIFLFIVLALIFVEYLSTITLKKVLNLILISPLILFFGFLASSYTHLRYYISNAGLSAFTDLSVFNEIISNFDFELWGLKNAFLGMFESVNFNVLITIFNSANYNNMFWGESYLKFLFTIIPRSIWPDKPETIAYKATEIISPTTEDLSIALTFIGEIHFNFLYLGFVLIIPFLSFVKFLLSTLYNDDSIATKYLSFSLGIILFRMAFSDVLVIMLISLALIYLCKIRVRV